MEIHILQAGEQIGPFSVTQVRQYLGAGVVSPSDLASCEGMPDWQSLDHLLANLPSSAPEAVLPDVPPPDSPVFPAPAPEPESPLIMHKEASETLELPTAPPPADPFLSLTASQRTKRKLSKIVIQPILPLEAAAPAPAKKKSQTGKTTLTLAPLRPTTSLPPVTGFAPKQKKNGKTLVRTGPVALRDFSEKPSTPPTPTPSLAPVTPPEPANWSPSPPPLAPLLPEKTTKFSSEKAWFQRIPREVLYATAGLALLLVCLIFSGLYLISSHKTSPAANPETTPPPPGQVVIPSPTSEADPKTAADYSARGFARQAKGDLDGALSDYNQALSLDPKDVEAFYRRGLAHQAQGDLDGAMADYTAVLGLDANQADAFSNRGFVKQAKGDLDGALADYGQALLINPKIAAAYYNEGLIEVQKGYLDGAIADYNHALDLDPKMAIAYYNRGVAKNSEGNLEGAIADYTQALTLNPQIALAYCNRGFARQTKGDTDGALADYSQALALNPKMAVVFYNRGLIKVQKGDLEGAIADSSQAIDLEPKSGPAYCNRGLARLGTGDLDGAMADLRTFCELAPKDSGVDSARLYMWVMATEQNPKGTADQELSTSLLNNWNSPPEDLTSKIAAFLLGHIHESDLIANAASPDPSRAPGQYCKVWYFAGMKRLLAGDMATAIKYFQKSVATEQKDSCEYIFAQTELRALGQNRSVAARPESGL